MLKKDWWKSSTVYQIYPKSFYDSNGDGIGDIQGIIKKLDYLKELGVDVLWLTPIYVSPMADNGYDIADYYNIDETFGTMKDFEKLLTEVHNRDMKLIMDMVINHTSTKHFWFKEALKGEDNKYHNYYIWKKGKDGLPPNNWLSKFGGSAWKYVEHLDKYYLHLFDVTQADLNWENENLRNDIYSMINFWLNKGVDGFRLDVINLISKNQNFPNDTLDKASNDGRRFYTDGPKIHKFLKELTANTFGTFENKLTVGEMSSTTIENCIKYTNPENKELTMAFNFHHLKVDYPNGEKWKVGKMDFQQLKDILIKWQVEIEKGNGWNAVFWCNHDQPRIVSRFGNEKYLDKSAKMLGASIHLLRGTPYVYQGEEIGMTNPHFKEIKQYKDVESLNNYKLLIEAGNTKEEALEILAQKSRDNSRTPIQWDSSYQGGFTKGIPWIDMGDNYKEINVENNLKDKNSIFYFYKNLIQLRKNLKVISEGSFIPILQNHPQIFGYIREFKNEQLLVLNNFFENEVIVEIPNKFLKGEVIINNYPNTTINNKIKLKAYETLAIYIKE